MKTPVDAGYIPVDNETIVVNSDGKIEAIGGGSDVSGTNDGNNWTSLTINGDTYAVSVGAPGPQGPEGPQGPAGQDGRDGAIQYTAGTNITIDENNVISATGGGTNVSGTNDGTNWTSITIDSDTYAIPQGGSSGSTVSASTQSVQGALTANSINIDGVDYNMPSGGGSGSVDVDDKTIKVNGDGELETAIGGWVETTPGFTWNCSIPFHSYTQYFGDLSTDGIVTYADILNNVHVGTNVTFNNGTDVALYTVDSIYESDGSISGSMTSATSYLMNFIIYQNPDRISVFIDDEPVHSDSISLSCTLIPEISTYHPIDANFIPHDNSLSVENGQLHVDAIRSLYSAQSSPFSMSAYASTDTSTLWCYFNTPFDQSIISTSTDSLSSISKAGSLSVNYDENYILNPIHSGDGLKTAIDASLDRRLWHSDLYSDEVSIDSSDPYAEKTFTVTGIESAILKKIFEINTRTPGEHPIQGVDIDFGFLIQAHNITDDAWEDVLSDTIRSSASYKRNGDYQNVYNID